MDNQKQQSNIQHLENFSDKKFAPEIGAVFKKYLADISRAFLFKQYEVQFVKTVDGSIVEFAKA